MIKWSFSSLKQYKTCPKQYYELRVACNFKSRDGADSIYGKEVHKALEDYVRDGVPLAANYARFKPLVAPLLELDGERLCEHEMALREDLTPCSFTDENYWVRGIADLLIVDGDMAFIVDYKTGKPHYADTKQLKLMALMVFAHYPKVMIVKSGLLFLLHNLFIDESYKRSDSEAIWRIFTPDLERLKVAFDKSVWPANPNGLCRKYCPVETCAYYGGR